jgi:hypothetical protein
MIEQKWEGVVKAVHGNLFVAHLKDLTDRSNPDEAAMVPLRSVAEEERPYVAEGAIFTWTILADEDDHEKSTSVFEFNKEVWTQEQIDEAKKQGEELFDRLNIE